MSLKVRPERPPEFEQVEELHRLAFGGPNEAQVVANVRRAAGHLPDFSLVGILDSPEGEVLAGHILFSHVGLEDDTGTVRRVLVLGPLAVHPDFQRRGVAGGLIRAGVQQAEARGEALIVVRGWDRIYGPFGFMPASAQGIVPPGDLPARSYLARSLAAYTPDFRGTLRYPAAFQAVGYPVQWKG